VPRIARPSSLVLAAAAALSLGACTGLAAGPETAATTPMPVPRDSAWARARRALTAEVFTVESADSLKGRIVATRYASSSAKVGTPQACRVLVAIDLSGTGASTELAARSRWVAPQQMADKAEQVCGQERDETMQRIAETISPK
jgi:hypothetical protein